MRILAIDPGNTESAYLIFEDERIIRFGKIPNSDLLVILLTHEADHLAIEMVQSFGMAVGASVFDTIFWAGRFAQIWHGFGGQFSLVYRKDVKIHLCNSMRAKDGNIRQALIDRFGPPGTKKNPGGTYGVSKDVWSALAVAVTFSDKLENKKGE